MKLFVVLCTFALLAATYCDPAHFVRRGLCIGIKIYPATNNGRYVIHQICCSVGFELSADIPGYKPDMTLTEVIDAVYSQYDRLTANMTGCFKRVEYE